MSEKKRINTPPVIRVFLSSTFADMEQERSYFNEVIAPRLGRICSERGVSFFNVDLRWGITEEDQIGGQVLPICLGEIDKCRPYFIGMIGNRYGSLMETVPEHVSESMPWLKGKEGVSITEIEMLYAVLDREREDAAINSAFYIRSDRLSRELYADLASENTDALEKLGRLKNAIRSDSEVLCRDYDTVEEFGEKVMQDLLRWLDENFPETGDISAIRREWYNGEILRGYIENGEIYAFLDSYIESSRRSLLIYGDGARGKTACLTAWEPKNAKKILINCASDEAFADWSVIAMHILRGLCDFLPTKSVESIRQIVSGIGTDGNGELMSVSEKEYFRTAFLSCIREAQPEDRVVVVINDLNRLSDDSARLLSWLPSDTNERISLICSTNDDETVDNADVIGWNVKEMPFFSQERARDMINGSLRVYGKNLTSGQLDSLISSCAARYPGQLRFVISFLHKYGRFNNLDRLAGDIAAIGEAHGIHRYAFSHLTDEASEREARAARAVLGLLRASDIALTEKDCFELTQEVSGISQIEWAGVCRIFEQFDLIHGDYWYVRNEEAEKFIDELLSDDEMKEIHLRLALRVYDKLRAEVKTGIDANKRESVMYSKQIISSLRAARDWRGLEVALGDFRIIASLIEREPSVLRSAWLELFLEGDRDVAESLVLTARCLAEKSNYYAVAFCKMIHSLDMFAAHKEACEALGVDPSATVDEILWAYKLTDRGVAVYDKMNALKKKHRFRELCDLINDLLAADEASFNETELCKIYFFKHDAEEILGSYEDALVTANKYYTLALHAGYAEDIRTALQMRASTLYRLGRVGEALSIIGKIGKMAYIDGRTRDYLSSLNMTAMCYYRSSRFDESAEIFDKLVVYWEKLSDKSEVCSTMINKCNALHLNGKTEEALDAAETFYATIRNDRGLFSSIASLCGNIGVYSAELGLYEKAEKYLKSSIEIAKMIGAESTLANVYATLGNVYFDTDSVKKGIELYEEQMEFHWNRREYEKVMETYKKSFSWLSTTNHKVRAAELETRWRERFMTVEGGLDYFERSSEKHTADVVTVEKLLEIAKTASSAGDLQGEASAYVKLSEAFEENDPTRAAQYLINAAMCYMHLGDNAARCDVLEEAMKLLFSEGQIADIPTYDTVVAVSDDAALDQIGALWRELGDLAYRERMQEEGKLLIEGGQEELFNDAIGRLLALRERNEYLTVCCIFDLAFRLVKVLSADTLLSIVSKISDEYRESIIDRFDIAMAREMDQDVNYLMKNYYGSRADLLLERYEKYITVLAELDGPNAPAIAGNVALIFRRRKEKEKAFRYHALSADIFRRAGKMNDCFIEIMNGATARKELSSVAEAVELLRDGLQEAIEKANRKFAAMFAGNLASTLMQDMKDDDRAEIESCFAIEERYFRGSGSWRDLVISLINQSAYYIKIGASSERIRYKVEEARALATEAKLSEFGTILSQLEWSIAESERGSSLSEESIRENVAAAFKDNGYTVGSFEGKESYYYVMANPNSENRLFEEIIHAAVPFNADCCLRIIAVIQPALYKGDSEALDEYIEWWNSLDKYKLKWIKEDKQIKADITLHAPTWEQLSARFGYFKALWEADKMNCLSLMMGVVDLDACRQAKLKVLE